MADSLCCTEETSSIEKQLYSNENKSSNKLFLKNGREGQKNGLERFKYEKELICQH